MRQETLIVMREEICSPIPTEENKPLNILILWALGLIKPLINIGNKP